LHEIVLDCLGTKAMNNQVECYKTLHSMYKISISRNCVISCDQIIWKKYRIIHNTSTELWVENPIETEQNQDQESKGNEEVIQTVSEKYPAKYKTWRHILAHLKCM